MKQQPFSIYYEKFGLAIVGLILVHVIVLAICYLFAMR